LPAEVAGLSHVVELNVTAIELDGLFGLAAVELARILSFLAMSNILTFEYEFLKFLNNYLN
jgi:hypothetical protein